jgi:hypothetical protein
MQKKKSEKIICSASKRATTLFIVPTVLTWRMVVDMGFVDQNTWNTIPVSDQK